MEWVSGKKNLDAPSASCFEKLERRQEHRRIIGGSRPTEAEMPWMVRLRIFPNKIVCAGSIISTRHILTGAHCLFLVPDDEETEPYELQDYVEAWIGDDFVDRQDPCEQKFTIHKFIYHKSFKMETMLADVAVLYTEREMILYPPYIDSIDLPYPNMDLKNKKFKTAGWGISKLNKDRHQDKESKKLIVLRDIPLVEQNKCAQSYIQMKNIDKLVILMPHKTICAGFWDGGKDSCSGDSGGPLCWIPEGKGARGVIVGIISFGYSCAQKGFAPVHTDVRKYVDWIKERMNEFASFYPSAKNIQEKEREKIKKQKDDNIRRGIQGEDGDMNKGAEVQVGGWSVVGVVVCQTMAFGKLIFKN